MSHASVVIALTPTEIQTHGSVESAVEWNMHPFDENDEYFRDGSRWDWYQVGGRFTGNLSGYDPYTDPANEEICTICAGTGIRPNGLRDFGADWYENCHGCNGCSGKGKQIRFQLKEHAGDVLLVSELSPEFKSSYAFLSNRHWHEPERMGWFGTSTYTECELAAKKSGNTDIETMIRRCLHKDEATGARIVCWNEPFEIWEQEFRGRFIAPLAPDTRLVNVDYHV